MAVKHKEIKRCKMITQTMVRDHNLGPGSLLVFKDQYYFQKYNVEIDDRNVVVSKPAGRYLHTHTVPANEAVLFVDVVYDPHLRNHYLRFLHNDQMIALMFKKGETIKQLKTKLSIGDLPDESDDE